MDSYSLSIESVVRKLLRVSWITRTQILKEINPEYSLEGLMLKLKLRCFGHLMLRADSLEKTLTGKGGEKGDGGWDGWITPLDISPLSKLWEIVRDRKPDVLWSMGSQRLVLNNNKGLPRWLSGKESTCNAGDTGSMPGLRRLPG